MVENLGFMASLEWCGERPPSPTPGPLPLPHCGRGRGRVHPHFRPRPFTFALGRSLSPQALHFRSRPFTFALGPSLSPQAPSPSPWPAFRSHTGRGRGEVRWRISFVICTARRTWAAHSFNRLEPPITHHLINSFVHNVDTLPISRYHDE